MLYRYGRNRLASENKFDDLKVSDKVKSITECVMILSDLNSVVMKSTKTRLKYPAHSGTQEL